MISENDFVRHSKFGIGKVLEIFGTARDPRVKIFFIGGKNIGEEYAGEKTIVPNEKYLSVLNNDELNILYESPDFILLKNINISDDNSMYRNINKAIIGFKKELNTEDFDGEFYLTDERNYKVHFHKEALKYFNEKTFKALLEQNDYETLFNSLKTVFSSRYDGYSQNLTDNRFETPKLYDALENEENKELFFNTLFDLLYGSEDFETRFNNWISVLKRIKFAKWTIATIFLFIIYPDKYMFVKPNTTKNALEISGFGTSDYDSVPTYKFYEKVLLCSKYIFEKTKEAGLNPKDMIDIQSFMWCIRPEYNNDGRAQQNN